MFKNFYTTQMSANSKQLQTRFTKMRSKTGRFSKLMATVMAIAILATMSCATVVMAAVDSDGLERWDKNEVYFLDGTKTTISIEGYTLPQWVYDDVTDNGSMELTIKRYETRNTSGWLEPMDIVEMSGNKGAVKLASQSNNRGRHTKENIDTNPQNEIWGLVGANKMNIEYRFIEFNGAGYDSIWKSAYKDFISPLSGKYRGINVCFVLSDDWKIEKAFVQFTVNDANDNPSSEGEYIEIPYSGFTEIGGFEKNMKEIYIRVFDYAFSSYEKNYTNKKIDGVNIAVTSAKENGISVDIKNNLPQNIVRTEIEVFNEYESRVSVDLEKNSSVNGNTVYASKADFPVKEEWEKEKEEGKFLVGHTYRVTVKLIDDDNNLVYRWQDYVTIK